jgi:hypothetical protein
VLENQSVRHAEISQVCLNLGWQQM